MAQPYVEYSLADAIGMPLTRWCGWQRPWKYGFICNITRNDSREGCLLMAFGYFSKEGPCVFDFRKLDWLGHPPSWFNFPYFHFFFFENQHIEADIHGKIQTSSDNYIRQALASASWFTNVFLPLLFHGSRLTKAGQLTSERLVFAMLPFEDKHSSLRRTEQNLLEL